MAGWRRADATDGGLAGRIPEAFRRVLQPGFPDLDLDSVRLRWAIPWLVTRLAPLRPAGFTLGRTIHIDVNVWARLTDPERAGLLAHELAHVRQFRTWGGVLRYSSPLGMGLAYVFEYLRHRVAGRSAREAYLAISFETEARSAEAAWRARSGGGAEEGRSRNGASGDDTG